MILTHLVRDFLFELAVHGGHGNPDGVKEFVVGYPRLPFVREDVAVRVPYGVERMKKKKSIR